MSSGGVCHYCRRDTCECVSSHTQLKSDLCELRKDCDFWQGRALVAEKELAHLKQNTMKQKRLEALELQRGLFPEGDTLVEICMSVKMELDRVIDNAPTWHSDQMDVTLDMLRKRLETWQPSIRQRDVEFDIAVHDLVVKTLRVGDQSCAL